MAFESLYIGATGMITHGDKMSNVGNNLANMNTLAYKTSNVHFENLFSDTMVTGGTASSVSQQGHGASVASVITDYRQGALDTGSDVLDIAIGGKGFYRVADGDETYYTRAGNFRFDNQGCLVDPHGYALQGKPALATGGFGSTQDIQLELNEDGTLAIDPEATTSIAFSSNLGTLEDNTQNTSNPYFALHQHWDGTAAQPLGSSSYSFAQNIAVYDENGDSHTLIMYFDGVGTEGASTGGDRVYEYILTMDPSEDARFTGSGAKAAGLLMAGTMTFSSSGQAKDMTAYTYDATASGAASSLSSWTLADLDASGHPQFSASFGASGASATNTISLDMGVSSSTGTWETAANAAGTAAETWASNASALPSMGGFTLSNLASTAFSGTASTLYQYQDGFPEGELSYLEISREGVISGEYTNGQSQDLFKIQVYLFTNEYGLRSEGNNHYLATTASGAAIEGDPLEGARGSILSNSLEQSNVDMAKEFVTMIMTQRGFQANSKVITTTNEMLKEAVNMKRM